MRVEDLGFLVGEVVLDPGEEGGPGGVGVGHRPVGTSRFNSSNQLRTTNLWGKAPRYVCNSRVVAATWDGLDVLLARLCTYFCFVARKPE